MIEVAVFGAGRIGRIHAENVRANPQARLRYVVDEVPAAAEALAAATGAEAVDQDVALGDSGVGAVIVASSTPSHVPLILAAARAGKAIFCEKPIDLDLGRVDEALDVVERAQVPFMVGFNRRFDPSFAKVKAELAAGAVGRVELVGITSRDPRPPDGAYLARSGGLFRDMMIHDLDMARWLLGEEPVTVSATASALVSPEAAALGDVDTAVVVLKAASGAIAHISNSRRAAYGYDQRVEVLGAHGMVEAENWRRTTVRRWGQDGVVGDRPPDFFLERYREAYVLELQHFFAALSDDETPLLVGPHDGRQALALSEAALLALATGKTVEVAGFERRR
jgi:myo-inositol 2-dehydrogenase/D-chiro-inositol 1-dehydrogenase